MRRAPFLIIPLLFLSGVIQIASAQPSSPEVEAPVNSEVGQEPVHKKEAKKGTIVVSIKGLRNIGQGELLVMLYQKTDRIEMDPKKAFKLMRVPVEAAELKVSFQDIPFGEYAVGYFHDMDGNKKLKSNWIGIPREDLAVSNNARGGPLGGPKWEEAKFTLNKPKMEIKAITTSEMY